MSTIGVLISRLLRDLERGGGRNTAAGVRESKGSLRDT